MSSSSTSLMIASKGRCVFRSDWRRISPMSITFCSLPRPSSIALLLLLRQFRPGFRQPLPPWSVCAAIAIAGERSGSVPIVDDIAVKMLLDSLLQILLRANFYILAEPLQSFFPICNPLTRLCSTNMPGSRHTQELNRNFAHHLQCHIELFRLLNRAA